MSVSYVSLVGGSGMIAVAIGFIAFAAWKRLGWKYLGLGALLWVLSVALKVATALPLNARVVGFAQTFAWPWDMLVEGVYGGVLTGIFEVGLVWLILRQWRLGNLPWSAVLAFGIGFGAIEALLLGASSLTVEIVALVKPERLSPGILEQLGTADSWLVQMAPICERFFTCLGHIGTNAMIFYSLSRRSSRWFWLAFVFKSAIDGVATVALQAGYVKSLAGIWTIEAIAAAWGVAGLLITIWIGRRYRQASMATFEGPRG